MHMPRRSDFSSIFRVPNVDLSTFNEIGVADLILGSSYGASGRINIGKIKVYTKSVKR
ncbi:MAG: hypothetical protein AB7F79_02460 [Steroidobacteraceae bacterium]